MSIKDGLALTVFYFITVLLCRTETPFTRPRAISTFLVISVTFSFLVEKISIKKWRWEYVKKIPTIFEVGITPLLELAFTGFVTLGIVLTLLSL
ncbi:MAG: hypothetical protein IIA61_07205 [Candidatus Marinimicrobia bacterium]|nr:hypothetical protein [Candidatus Neomarinimicrobiota bacterium]